MKPRSARRGPPGPTTTVRDAAGERALRTTELLFGVGYRVPLTREDLERHSYGRVITACPNLVTCTGRPRLATGYEEHASYPIDIQLPRCVAHGRRAIDCPECPTFAPKTAALDGWDGAPNPKPLDTAKWKGIVRSWRQASGLPVEEESVEVAPSAPAPEAPDPVAVVDAGEIPPLEVWCDGSGTTDAEHGGAGVVVARGGRVLAEASLPLGLATNNVAEVTAVRAGLELAAAVAGSRGGPVVVRSDSQFALGATRPGSTHVVRANPAIVAAVDAARAEAARWPAAALTFAHVKGHAGVALNERADHLARRARRASAAGAPRASTAAAGAPAALPELAFVDCETGGRSPARDALLEVAVVRTSPCAHVIRSRWAAKIRLRPDTSFDPDTTKIHGYEPRGAAWRQVARELGDVVPALRAALAGAVFVSHNVPFDLAFIRAACARVPAAEPALAGTLCTMTLARRLARQGLLPNARLEDLAHHFGVTGGRAHHALDDAVTLLRVYRRLLPLAAHYPPPREAERPRRGHAAPPAPPGQGSLL